MFVLGAGVIAAAGVGRLLSSSIDEAREAQKVGAATTAIIKATGGAAKITAGQVGDMANRLSLATGIDDEAIQSGENLLLTFKNVRNEVGGKFTGTFDRATASALDLSAAGFGSIESASKTLGKALNDPIKGVSALSRAGVTFSDQQKEQIKTMVESGNILGAQNIILKEVEGQVGGVAAATATSGEKAKVAFDNIKESIGTALLPLIDKLANKFVALAPAIQSGLTKLGPLLTSVGKALFPVVRTLIAALFPIVKKVFEFLSTHTKVLAVIAGGLLFLFAPLTTVALGMALLYTKSKTVRDIFAAVSGFVTGTLIPGLSALADFFVNRILPTIVDVATSVGHSLAPVFAQLAETFTTKVLPGVSKLVAKFEEARPTIARVVEVVFKVVGTVIKLYAAVAGKVLPVLIRLVAFLVGKFFSGLGSAITQIVATVTHVVDFGKKVVAAAQKVADFVTKASVFFGKLVSAVREKVGKVITTVSNLPGKMLGALGNLGKILYDAGKQIIQGLIDGISAKFGDLKDKLGEVGGFIKNHKGPPAKDKIMLVPAGQLIMDGLIAGIESREKKLTDALDNVTGKISKKVKEQAAKIRDSLASVRSDFASLSEPIASNFTQGLFDFDTASAFTSNLAATKATITALIGNFKKLIGEGLAPGFLYQLFQSGGPALINSLAGLDASSANAAGSLFGDVMSLSNQLGASVAGATDKGAALENQTVRLERKLDKLIKHVDDSAEKTAEALSQPARRARRRAVMA